MTTLIADSGADQPPASAACVALVLGRAGEPAGWSALSARSVAARLGDEFGTRSVATETALSLEDLGQVIEDGRHVIAFVDAGVLWRQPAAAGGTFNHAVVVLDVRREEADGRVVGATIVDPHRGSEPTPIDAQMLVDGWLACGGRMVTVEE